MSNRRTRDLKRMVGEYFDGTCKHSDVVTNASADDVDERTEWVDRARQANDHVVSNGNKLCRGRISN